MPTAHNQVQGQGTIGHGNNRIDGIRFTAADQIAKALVDDIYSFAFIIMGREVLKIGGNQFPDSAQFFMPVGICGKILKNHPPAFIFGTLRD